MATASTSARSAAFGVAEPLADLGELLQDARLLLRVLLDVRQAPEQVGNLLAALALRGLVVLHRLGGDAAKQRAQGPRVARVDGERGAQDAVDVLRAREDLLVDAREREERRELRRHLAARRDDRLEGVDRLRPGALRDAELRQREQRRDVLRRSRAHAAHGVDGHREVLQLVARDARDLRAEHDDGVGRLARVRARCGTR